MGSAIYNRPDKTPRLLLVVERREEQEELRRRLAELEFGLRLTSVSTWAEALPRLEASEVDLILADLAALRAVTAAGEWEFPDVPFCLLVPPGAEEEAAELLEVSGADFILQAGDYLRLLPARLLRAERRGLVAEQLARFIRHEINNPLTGVLGNAELVLVENSGLPDRVRQRLATIIQLAVRLRDVVRELEARLGGREKEPNGSLPAGGARGLPLRPGVLS